MLLEVCAFNIQSCFAAEQGGADRIELCAEPQVGGTTPSYGSVVYALEHLGIPFFPMVRPRGGNFIYDTHDLAIMQQDIAIFRQLGVKGIATGVQLQDGRIDTEQMKRIVEWAYPMEVSCHKVFDGVPNAAEGLEALINAGCKRVLTSGLKKTAPEGAVTLAALVAQAADRIIIMPGGSVRSSNIAQLARETGASEFHSSALITRDVSYLADVDEVRKLHSQLRSA